VQLEARVKKLHAFECKRFERGVVNQLDHVVVVATKLGKRVNSDTGAATKTTQPHQDDVSNTTQG